MPPDEAELDPLSLKEVENSDDETLRKKVEIVQDFARRERTGKPRLLTLRFLVSPTELVAGEDGGVRLMRLVKNSLVDEDGRLGCRPTAHAEELPIDLVFRSVGYRGVPVDGLPFHERWGLIPNDLGRVTDPESSEPITGMYVSGWIKRGPSGVIGTNKKDGAETAAAMLEDVAAGAVLAPSQPEGAALEALVRERQPSVVTYSDWTRIDEIECARGEALGRPRVKFVSRSDVRDALKGD